MGPTARVPAVGRLRDRSCWGRPCPPGQSSEFLQPAAFSSSCPGPWMSRVWGATPSPDPWPLRTCFLEAPWAHPRALRLPGGGGAAPSPAGSCHLLTRRSGHTHGDSLGSAGPCTQPRSSVEAVLPGATQGWGAPRAAPAVAPLGQQRRVAAHSAASASGRCSPVSRRARVALRSEGRGRFYFGYQ